VLRRVSWVYEYDYWDDSYFAFRVSGMPTGSWGYGAAVSRRDVRDFLASLRRRISGAERCSSR